MKTIENSKGKRHIESILLICALVTMSMLVVFPLNVPTAKAQVLHQGSTADEDGIFPFDIDGLTNGIVMWDQSQDHHIQPPSMPGTPAYVVNSGYELRIPALDWTGNPATQHEITFLPGAFRMDVEPGGTLTTQSGGPMGPFDKTLFWPGPDGVWDGINFFPGSSGTIVDCAFFRANFGVVFFSGSTMTGGGISLSVFQDIGQHAVQIENAFGNTNIANCQFTDSLDQGTSVYALNTDLTINTCFFTSHGSDMPQLHIENSNVYATNSWFIGSSKSGNEVLIEGSSNGTVFDKCSFEQGSVGDHYVRVDGNTPFFDNCSFDTSGGSLSVMANDDANGVSAHPILRNPAGDGSPGQFWDDSFDNSTMNVTGDSSITLQWYMNVNVMDPDSNSISNAPVWVKDGNDDPVQPPSITTDATGWANWFVCTELIQYNNSVTNYNPFKASSENNSMIGFADPEPTMNMSKEVTVIVPFNPVPNIPPKVSWISTPVGVQSGYVTIDYMLEDPNPGDDGNLSVEIYYSLDGLSYRPATPAPSSPSTENLNNNTLYTFMWNSKADEPSLYNTTVYIFIIPYDRVESGPLNQTGSFVLDNEPPQLQSGPTVDVTNTTAIINWTVHESANASVWYGLDGSLTDQASGSTGTTSQSVTLTALETGRQYTYIIISVDQYGNVFSSNTYEFETEVHIHLYKGWNMISIPPFPSNPYIDVVLAPIAGQYEAVQWYDPSDPDDPWKHYKPGKPYGNDLLFILPTMGFWIHMKNDAIFIPDQEVPPSDSSIFIPLFTGWNLVGYPSVTTRDVDTALSGVPYDMVQTYDAATGQWLSYDPNTGSGDLSEMELSRGYWIHATANHDWEVYYV